MSLEICIYLLAKPIFLKQFMESCIVKVVSDYSVFMLQLLYNLRLRICN